MAKAINHEISSNTNSQSFNSSENQNSVGRTNTIAKKRQRKQDKTRKLPSQLQFQPTTDFTQLQNELAKTDSYNFNDYRQISQISKDQTEEIQNLRNELSKAQIQLNKKSIEVEKSQQLFQMFDQQIKDF